MATVVRETERKYELADEVELPGWNGLVGVQPVVGPEEQPLEAVYFDTEDLGLARAGVTRAAASAGTTRVARACPIAPFPVPGDFPARRAATDRWAAQPRSVQLLGRRVGQVQEVGPGEGGE